MHFVLFSDIDESSIRDKLGKPEYSYYFVLKAFRPAIEQLGSVTLIRKPEIEVDPIYDACAARGERCVFVSFTPPNSVPLNLRCPTVMVFAWEFSTIPDGDWEPFHPKNDWRFALARVDRSITLSNFTARITKAAMGEDFPVFAIAAPVWDRVVRPGRTPSTAGPLVAERELRIRGTVIDSATLTLYPERIFEPGFPPPIEVPPVPEPVGETPPPESVEEAVFVEVVAESPPAPVAETALETVVPEVAPPPRRPHGLRYVLAVTKRHLLEWYREAIRDMLPKPLRWLISRLGGLIAMLYRGLRGGRPPEPPVVEPPQPELVVLAPVEPPLPEPPALESAPPPPSPLPEVAVRLGGIVYTSVLNPSDGRKNWPDMVTAFCFAFRDVADVTLVLKMIKGDSQSYRHELFIMLAQLAPFKCRVVTLDGFLEDEDYAGLIDATTYYANASNAEGLCLPLMEFMALGKPAIAPRHTAMEDYIEPSAAFIVDSSPEHNVWPNDPRQRFSTMRERIHWDTLVTAFEESYRVAKGDFARYRAMADRAAEIIHDYSSDAVVREQLRAVFESIRFPEPVAPPGPEAGTEEPQSAENPKESVLEAQTA